MTVMYNIEYELVFSFNSRPNYVISCYSSVGGIFSIAFGTSMCFQVHYLHTHTHIHTHTYTYTYTYTYTHTLIEADHAVNTRLEKYSSF